MKFIQWFVAGIILNGFLLSYAYADVAVIVNKNSTLDFTIEQIREVFLGKLKATDTNEAIDPYDFSNEEEKAREEFLNKVLHKKASNFNAHWARILFSSKGRPPRKVGSAKEMLDVVSRNVNGIGYINLDDVDDSVRVMLVVK